MRLMINIWIVSFFLLKKCFSDISLVCSLSDALVNIPNTTDFYYTLFSTSFSSSYANSSISLTIEATNNEIPEWMKVTKEFGTNVLDSFSIRGSRIYVKGDFAFIGGNDGLKIMNISNPLDVVSQFEGSVPFSNFFDLFVDENERFLYVSNGPEVQIFDIYTNISEPIELGSARTSNSRGIFSTEDLLFVADDENGFSIFNVSNSSNPLLISNWESGVVRAYGIIVKDNYCFLSCDIDGVRVYDVRNLQEVFLVGIVETISALSVSVFEDDDRYILVDDGEFGIKLVDITNISNPFIYSSLGNLNIPFQGVEIIGSSSYSLVADGSGGLKFVSLLNKRYPFLDRTILLSNDVESVTSNGDYVFVVGNDLDFTIIETNSINYGDIIFDGSNSHSQVDQNINSFCGGNLTIVVTARDKEGSEISTDFVIAFLDANFTQPPYFCVEENGRCNFDLFSCDCFDNLYGKYCSITKCFDHFSNETLEVCSGKGFCERDGTCTCYTEDFYGDECGNWLCWNISRFEYNKVCGSHGFCASKDACYCSAGYNSLEAFGECTEFYCGSFHKSEAGVCNSRGVCVDAGQCKCKNDYEGNLCDSWSCVYEKESSLACSGHGTCVAPSDCVCDNSYGGEMCSTFTAYAAIFVPIGLAWLGCCSCVFCCVCYCLLCLILSCFSCCGVIFAYFLKISKKVRKFRKLKNFNILLREQQSEDDDSIAHIRLKQDLYSIEYDEIKVDKLIGEGGSSSMVFKAHWKNKIVAFKCFKTRLVCQSQSKFEDFEKEVEVLSSLKHPHIIQFFGATVKPPRVGIVMEYCENGDLVYFLNEHRIKKFHEYPQEEKIRMCFEISLSMGYLHSRNIVHRDLKLENVLVSDDYSTKLMDFGLSKIVERMSQVRTTKIGTNIYMAPEVISSDRYSEKCDVYSFSILCFIMITENWDPYGTGNMMVEFKVSSNPNFRPDISIFDRKISKENQWLRDIVTKNWGHSYRERDSFAVISEIFRNKAKQLLSKGDGSERDSIVLAEREEEIVMENDWEKELFQKRNEFEDSNKFKKFLGVEIQNYKEKIAKAMGSINM